jgi:hypothetical protein
MKQSFDIEAIRLKILSAKKTKIAVTQKLEEIANNNKLKFYNEFVNHPVTREIDEGENASNISNTLGGKGNLFSFIGFQNGFLPTSPVKDLIKSIRLIKTSIQLKKNTYTCKVKTPSIESFASVSKMPWEPGRSWLLDIEKTISGLSSYIYGKFVKSRSGTGLQNTDINSQLKFKRVSYFTELYEKYIRNLQK